MKWSTFLLIVLLLYFVSNIIFGAFYSMLGPESLVDVSSTPTENLFIRGFFFSVQTFATIGYGTIHPVGVIPNLLVTIESYYSCLLYTSDAADERSSVDLGGRRIIKKKNYSTMLISNDVPHMRKTNGAIK